MSQFNNVPIDGNRVHFSAGAKIFIGPAGTAFGALPRAGLLASDQAITLDPRATQRLAKGGFPRITVAAAPGDQDPVINAVLAEMSQTVIMAGLGLEAADVTAITGSDVTILDTARERVVFNSNGIAALAHPVKAGGSVTLEDAQGGSGTAYTAGTDFRQIDRDLEGRTLLQIISGGGLTAGDEAFAAYTWVQAAGERYPVGAKNNVAYKAVKIEDEQSSGAKLVLEIPKCIISSSGAISLGQYEPEQRMPLTIQPVYSSVDSKLFDICYYTA